jgi:hypothetical protein
MDRIKSLIQMLYWQTLVVGLADFTGSFDPSPKGRGPWPRKILSIPSILSKFPSPTVGSAGFRIPAA